jgi:spore germination protein GerM
MRAILLLFGAALLVGCGVQLDAEPRVYSSEVQAEVQAALAPSDSAGSDEVPNGDLVDLYFLTGGRLAAVRRTVANLEPATIMQSLIDGPNAVEQDLDLRSAIPPTTVIRSIVVSGGVGKVDLSRDFAAIGGQEEILAVAQVVVTLVASLEIDGVLFALDGVDTAVPRADGSLIERPLEIADFRVLLVEDD